MALAVLTAGALRAVLPESLPLRDASWMLAVFVVVVLAVLVIGDPGRIDREETWLRVVTRILIGVITLVNGAAAALLVADILGSAAFTDNARTLLGAGAADEQRPERLGSTAVVRPPEVVDEGPDDGEDPQHHHGEEEEAPEHREQRVVVRKHQLLLGWVRSIRHGSRVTTRHPR
jgi:hypothetical protein